LLALCILYFFPASSFVHSVLPLAASTHTTIRLPSALPPAVTKTRSPYTTGLEWPGPGNFTFQATCFFSHFAGTSTLPLPSPLGPRNLGQMSAPSAATATHNTAQAAARYILISCRGWWGRYPAHVIGKSNTGAGLRCRAGRERPLHFGVRRVKSCV